MSWIYTGYLRVNTCVARQNGTIANVQTHEIFCKFSGKGNPERVLRLMNESGWLDIYMPDFGRIVGMMQFDMYHSYTVDEHSLRGWHCAKLNRASWPMLPRLPASLFMKSFQTRPVRGDFPA